MTDKSVETEIDLSSMKSTEMSDATNQNEVSAEQITSIDINLLGSLFNCAPDVAFFVKNSRGRYLAVNDSLIARLGLKDKQQILGKTPSELCSGELGEAHAVQDLEVLKNGHPIIEHLELHLFRPECPVWCLTTKMPIKNSFGEVIGLIGFSRDVRIAVNVDEIPPKFASALARFEKDMGAAISPASLAEESALTSQKLIRLTKKLYGITPTQLIAKIRIAAACRQLEETDQSIADIAFSCGFSDHSAFTRAFKSSTGVTPSVYRSQANK